MLLTILVFLLILSVLVLIHEAGHFFVARWFGIKVEEFGFGLPPRIWGKKKGETIYSLNWLPIGGFVKLYGEDEAGSGRVSVGKGEHHAKEDHKRAFYSKPIGQRALVILAGVLMNTILAVVIYYVFMFMAGFRTELPLIGDHKFFFVEQIVKTDIIVEKVAKNSPAEKAHMVPFSKVVSINGEKVVSTKSFLSRIQQEKGKEITLEWEDSKTNQRSKAVMVPRVNPPKNEGSLGVTFFPMESVILIYDTPAQKVFSGLTHPANLMAYNFSVMKTLLGVSIKEKNVEPISQGVSGPVGIYSLVGTIINIPNLKEKILQILNLSGLLSISLAFFNVLPIPGLDGGRLFFIVVEGVTRKKVNPKYEGYAHAIGMAILLLLMLLVTFKDIMQFIIK